MASIIGTVGSDIYLPASSRAIIMYDDREITSTSLSLSLFFLLASPIPRDDFLVLERETCDVRENVTLIVSFVVYGN